MKLKLYTVDGMFDSKWGQLPLWRHAWNYCPYDPPNYRTKYYAHYGRTVSYKTFGDISYPYDRRIASNADLSVTNTTVVSGAIDDLAAADAVIFGTPTRFSTMTAQMKQFLLHPSPFFR